MNDISQETKRNLMEMRADLMENSDRNRRFTVKEINQEMDRRTRLITPMNVRMDSHTKA